MRRSLTARVLALHTEGPEFNPQHGINHRWWHAPVVPEVKSYFGGHFQIHGETETCLGYIEPVKGRKCRLNLGETI